MRNPDTLGRNTNRSRGPADTSAAETSTDVRLRVAVAVAAVLLVALLVRSFDPFGWFDPAVPEETSAAAAGDVTLIEIREAAELKAASGTFSVPVTMDTPRTGLRQRLPEFLDGEKIVAIYQGDVDATIDLRGLTAEGIEADPASRSITVRVPAPRLSEPRIDHEKSGVVSHQRGVVRRVEDALGDGSLAVREELDRAAVSAIARAAAESDLRATAETNGTRFLTLLCQRLGYERVTIEYAEPAR
ncbi:DUF4230 domain-containing protein [Granulicoccus sp. GXG6511]|uniref:DUF4230 domain-containing protein n=1 Tax=Granulicoccus sp. GXG6511 TaxID=3381351 RepID=UPI003D7E68B2